MKTQLFTLSLMAGIGAVAISSFTPAETSQKYAFGDEAQIKKGEYLVTIMGCGDCHTPKKFGPQGPEPDMSLNLSGHPAKQPIGKVDKSALQSWVLFNHSNTAAVGPWGVSFSANLTSDASGIGTWSFEQFKIALTQGKSKGIATARPLLPPMPWPNYINMKDEDMKAIFAYLKSTKPINNVVPAPIAPDKL